MVTSGYATLAAFLAVLELAAALWAVLVGARSLMAIIAVSRDAAHEGAERLEARTYLAGLLAYLLLGISLLSWLVLYLMLDSFVPQWKGAMCIYGVTKIGSGSLGVYRWLPRLVLLEQALKPLLIFAIGAALVVYRFYRRQGTRAMLPPVAIALLLAAVLASVDAGVEIAYLAIPKRESLPNSGCCSVSSLADEHVPPANPHEQRRWTMAYYTSQAIMPLLLLGACGGGPSFVRRGLPLLLLAAATLAIAMGFFIHVVSPTLLHLPYHHCLYDLVAKVPESAVALLLLFWATCCVGWSALLNILGLWTLDFGLWTPCRVGWSASLSMLPRAETSAELGYEVRGWLAWALVGYLGSSVMISLDMWLA